MEARTDLDRGQCKGLLAALTREYAFIQGPPGTGKTYLGIQLMKILLHCKRKANLGPVVIVCYTNHALDQFLEHLLAAGIKKIIRIGGQSQSTLLEDHNLRNISQAEMKTTNENYLLALQYSSLDEETKRIKGDLGSLHSIRGRENWPRFQHHLQRQYPRIHAQFREIDEEGYESVGRHPFERWAAAGQSFVIPVGTDGHKLIVPHKLVDSVLLQKAEKSVYLLSPEEIYRLVQLWSQEIHDYASNDLFERLKGIGDYQQEIKIHDEVDRRVLQSADVIGITTTGLAKRISTLKRVRSKVVICEEAGEVMEAHMLSALLPTVEHFIQIGDHEQLRPQINNFISLSLESRQGSLYKLDRSQFERLSVGEPGRAKMQVAQLNVQRRMRPEISKLIRETIYPMLVDHPCTGNLPDVVGMRKNVFWLDHGHLEEGQHSEMHHKSHSNIWEVEMVHALVRHIVRQGAYKSSDIAVLTPYTGQLQKLRTAMQNDFEIVISDRDQEALEKDGFDDTISGILSRLVSSVVEQGSDGEFEQLRKAPLKRKRLSDLLRIATIDNFQGEEAKLIIVSLVRSNTERKVGFLKTTNRINVLLSRAQHGMYLIGNSDTYSNIPMWQKVIDMLRASDAVGNYLGLCCPRHEETPIQVSEPDDFPRQSPEGGCRLACTWRLPDCGHMCQARCHSESMHNILCHIAQRPADIRCNIPVPKKVSSCGHTVEVACWLDITLDRFRCPTPCATLLDCGHPCPGACGQCNTKNEMETPSISHQKCRKVCGRPFGTCRHTCRKPCHHGNECGPCLSPCEVRCQHSKCKLLCHEACTPCIERCAWACEHQGTCTMPCSAPCNKLPCDQRCSKGLPCGHQCPGLCGELCPEEYCHQCTSKQDTRVDLLEMKTYAEIDVNETPIVVLGCGHFFTGESLDGVVGLNEVYTSDESGRFTGLLDISGGLASKVPQCPDCQCPVRQYVTQRYNRLINRAVIDEMSKRFLVNGKMELRGLELQVDELENELETSISQLTDRTRSYRESEGRISLFLYDVLKKIETRYKKSRELNREINRFLRKVADRHQPAHKLHEATVHAISTLESKSKSLDAALASLSIGEPQESIRPVERDRRITLGGRMVQIKAECVVLEDKFSVAAIINSASTRLSAESSSAAAVNFTIPGGSPKRLTKPFLQICAIFIKDCNAENLPKLAVEASLYYTRVARHYRNSGLSNNIDDETQDTAKATEYINEARDLLEKALELCQQPFENADQLKKAAEESIKFLGKEWYEAVTPEELAAIKRAMVSGSRGLATHSGHWYHCSNGHPFAIGECGMPMEQARCPECGAPIGGSNHQAVAGVTRATEMET
ncbi:uncharacterized protein A1O5_03326 [Cladophialophora psammophila CBS 110553]|uniref:RZ-type domain-containing protein n=1 Tax=Cladophialophora psammophila CBS 110553 TaxID=1182543 RepID=W9X8B0_9EURO|nr:uncharacterized protein A1O5_03326 [Cladophialophora psammophila CBS 110553]EXJ73565.1 hypothetical protein A1O5_03326 [Cladophialophora psammophila CBS 110553]